MHNLNRNVRLYLYMFTDLLLERVLCWVSPYGATDMDSHMPELQHHQHNIMKNFIFLFLSYLNGVSQLSSMSSEIYLPRLPLRDLLHVSVYMLLPTPQITRKEQVSNIKLSLTFIGPCILRIF